MREYFAQLELPVEPTIYDALLLSLRDKDAVFTFNWDPFLFQAHLRLQRAGVPGSSLPTIWFLHGNVAVGYCMEHEQVRGIPGYPVLALRQQPHGQPLAVPSGAQGLPGRLDDRAGVGRSAEVPASRRHVHGVRLQRPVTDVEAKQLLKDAWGDVEDRRMEQTEIINRPGADHDELREMWSPFIHTHHYEIHESFYDSWIANHPRRTLRRTSTSTWKRSSSRTTLCRRNSPPSRNWWLGSSRCSRPSVATWMR